MSENPQEQSHTSSMEIDGNKQGVADLGNEVYNVRSAAITRRIASLLVYLIMLTLLLTFKNHLADPKHDLYEGATYREGSNGTIIGSNAQVSYPISLGEGTCTMEMLDDCVNQGVTDACCTAFNAGKKPAMTVSAQQLYIYTTVIPIAAFILRGMLINDWLQSPYLFFLAKKAPWGSITDGVVNDYSSWANAVEFHSIDTLGGLLQALLLNIFATNRIKVWASILRPNFLVLNYFADNSPAVFLKDCFALAQFYSVKHANGHGSLLGLVIPSFCFMFAFFIVLEYARIGVSRITDYWHSTADVLCGWAIGACVAIVDAAALQRTQKMIGPVRPDENGSIPLVAKKAP